MTSLRYKGKTIPYTNPSSSVSIASGATIVHAAGVRGHVGLATDTIAPLATGASYVEDVHELATLGTDTGSVGTSMYWDEVALLFTTASVNLSLGAGNYNDYAGELAQAKTSGQTTSFIHLQGLTRSGAIKAVALANASLTDSSGGAANGGGTLTAINATSLITIPVGLLASLANAQTLSVDPGFNGKIISANFRVNAKPASTAAKAATLTVEVAGTPVTGGVISLTTAGCNAAGALTAATAITALNTFTSGQAIGVAVSGVTTFVEGDGFIELEVVNTDLINALSTLAAQVNDLTTKARAAGLIG